MINIEFWINPFNPYSYLAKRTLDLALKKCEIDNATILWKWTPEAIEQEISQNWSFVSSLAKKMNQSDVYIQLLLEEFSSQSKQLGFRFDFENIKPPPTFSDPLLTAKLLKLSEHQENGSEFLEFLMETYFSKGEIITLEKMSDAGFDIEVASNNKWLNLALEEDKALTVELNINEAPFMILNEEIGLLGIQPINHLVDVLSMAQSSSKK